MLNAAECAENKANESKKGANEDQQANKETLTKRRKIIVTQRTKYLNSRKETKQTNKVNYILGPVYMEVGDPR